MGKSKKRRTLETAEIKSLSGFPFAKSFLLSDTDAGKMPNINTGLSQPMLHSKETVSNSIEAGDENVNCLKFVRISEKNIFKSAIGLIGNDSNSLYISGHCYITILWGSVAIHGFRLLVGKKYEIFSPAWTAALQIQIAKKKENTKLSSDKNKLSNALFLPFGTPSLGVLSQATCLVLIESISDNNHVKDWKYQCEDYSVYNIGEITCGEALRSANIVSISSAVIGTGDAMNTLQIDCTQLSSSWTECADNIIKSYKSSPQTVICGAKGVGKSTYLRYLVNRFLSKAGAVAVIDCDLGQAEFSPPGLVSLHIVRDPVLSAGHTNMRDAELSFFLGDTSSKHDPLGFVSAIQHLYARYLSILPVFQRTNQILPHSSINQSEAIPSFVSSTNAFDVLQDEDGGCSARYPLPLLVNTDGWIKYLGEELLQSVLQTIQSTFVVHLCTEKNRELSALRSLSSDVQIFELPPGRHSASRIPAADLRTLRMLSYFLKHLNVDATAAADASGMKLDEVHPKDSMYSDKDASKKSSMLLTSQAKVSISKNEMKKAKSHYAPIDYPTADSSMSSTTVSHYSDRNEIPTIGSGNVNDYDDGNFNGDDAMTSVGVALGAIAGVRIRSGAVVDPAGVLSRALLTSPALLLPLHPQRTSVRVVGGAVSIPPRLVLAALNAALVGIMDGGSLADDPVGLVRLRHPENTQEISIDCSYLGTWSGSGVGREALGHCVGLGIVRYIDISRQQLCLLTPISAATLRAMTRVCLCRGPMQPPLQLLGVLGSPVSPYQSAEVVGEGADPVRNRPNLKRRSQL